MTEVTLETASDDALRQTRVCRRWRVTRACKEPFEEELQMIRALHVLSEQWAPQPKTFWQRANFLRTLDLWWMRVGAAVKVMRLTHAINERRRGFEWARRQSIETALVFGCPRFMQGWLAVHYLRRAQKRKEEEHAIRERAERGNVVEADPIEA